MPNTAFAPILEVTRGDIVESIHFGAAAVVDAAGNLIAHLGDPNAPVYLRSSAKPFQILPLLEAGGHTHYGLTLEEIALICSSHSGTDQHVRVAESIQGKVGIQESNLMCGVHPPMHKETAHRMIREGIEVTQNRHDCSGKHSGMLGLAKMKGWPLETYLERDHPVQQAILEAFSEMTGVAAGEIEIGTDGCSAPNFAVPLYNAALAWARFADPSALPEDRARACRQAAEAVTAHPEMVAWEDRFDSAAMRAGSGMLLVKGGAEGYLAMGLLPGACGDHSPAMGIVLKVSDGDASGRARPAAALEILRQLGALSQTQLDALKDYGPNKDITNWRSLVVGEMRPCFTLKRN
ncbi:MAG: asparaginase [Anaerolineae bacterium]|nr:asparaginase [Anaerolineae bacterium]